MPESKLDDDMHNLLAALVEQARALASRMAGDPESPAPCQFCGGSLPLWENLLVLQLAGPAETAELQGALSDLLFVCIDDEGGWIQGFRGGSQTQWQQERNGTSLGIEGLNEDIPSRKNLGYHPLLEQCGLGISGIVQYREQPIGMRLT